MGTGIFFPIAAIPFILIVLILYYRKGHIKTKETSIFSTLIISNLFGLVIEMLCTYASSIYDKAPLVSIFIYKAYLLYLILWVFTMAYYVFSMLKGENTFNKKRIYLFTIFYAIVSLILWILPIEVVISSDFAIRYTSGASVYFTYGMSSIAMLYIFVMLLVNLKKVNNKRYLPVFIFLVIGTVTAIIQMLFPQLLLMTYIETIICVIMYFTIENPDLKVITELNIAKDQAEKANRAKSDFLSSMSHEIRTPLNAIVGLSEDMKEKDECPESMKEDLEDVVSASRTLLEIVGNIMDISKIESDKMEIIEVPYNFKEEIETLARINAVRIGDKQLELKVNIAEDIPYELVGDRGHVKEIVNNLLSNAIKYTDKGTVNLTVKCINENDICNLMISVEDTGRGIKKENIEKLFTKFERLDVERNTTTEGTGLGLAITKKLVELMGGKINVESEFGKGSIFIVHIPQRIGSMTRPITDTQLINTSEIVKESRKKRVNYKTKSILIVDDNKLNIKVARRSLEQLNFKTIDECYNGKECVDKIKNNEKYDIILMDIMMPIMSGETALEELKKIEGFNTPVIALTADAVAGAEERYKDEGFTSYISKPFNKDQIKIKLDSLFDNKKKEKEIEEDIWKDAPTYVFTSSLAKDNEDKL